MKKRNSVFSYLIIAFIACLIVTGTIYSGTVTRGLIGVGDLSLFTGSSSTEFQRATSTDYTMTMRYFDYPGVDVLQVYGGGVNANRASIVSALSAIEDDNLRMIYLAPTTWTLNDDLTIGRNVIVHVPPGAKFDVTDPEDTLTIAGFVLQNGGYPIKTSTSSTTLSGRPCIYYGDPSDEVYTSPPTSYVKINSHEDADGDTSIETEQAYDADELVITVAGSTTYWWDKKMSLEAGWMHRPRFEWSDVEEAVITPGAYEIDGHIAYWSSNLTKMLIATGSSQWHYLYIAGESVEYTREINEGDFVISTTTAAYNDGSRGWYNNNDRLIWAWLTDTDDDAFSWWHDGGVIVTWGTQADNGDVDVDTAWKDIPLESVPYFYENPTGVLITVSASTTASNEAGENPIWWTANSTRNPQGHLGNLGHGMNSFPIIVDTRSADTVISEWKRDEDDTDTFRLRVDGWKLPGGM